MQNVRKRDGEEGEEEEKKTGQDKNKLHPDMTD